MKKKHTIQVLLSVLLVALIVVGGTVAYLVASDSPVVNRFSFVDVDTDIEEPDGGDPINKTPKVKNEGDSTVFVRAKVIVAPAPGYTDPVSESDMTINYNKEADADNGKWEKKEDGWYYYTRPLEKDDETVPLFNGIENIKVAADSFDVIVYQESVVVGRYTNAYEAFNPHTSE